MKRFTALKILFFLLLNQQIFAADKIANIDTAQKVAIALEMAEYTNLGHRFDLQVLNVLEKEKQVKVELGIGTIERPARMHDCITITFTDAPIGYIQTIEKEIDAGTCEF